VLVRIPAPPNQQTKEKRMSMSMILIAVALDVWTVATVGLVLASIKQEIRRERTARALRRHV